MRSNDHKAGLERLGVLIARTRSRELGTPIFLVLGSEPPSAPESMIETQPIEIVTLSSMLGT